MNANPSPPRRTGDSPFRPPLWSPLRPPLWSPPWSTPPGPNGSVERAGPWPLGLTLVAVVLAAGLFGCGYSTKSLYNPDIRTVAIDVFKNDTFRRDLELELTTAVAREIRLRTPWRIANRSSADVVLTGRILDAQENVLGESQNDLVLESSVIVTAEARLTELSTGKVLAKIQRTSSVAFLIPRGQGPRYAFERSLRKLAEDLVQGFELWE